MGEPTLLVSLAAASAGACISGLGKRNSVSRRLITGYHIKCRECAYISPCAATKFPKSGSVLLDEVVKTSRGRTQSVSSRFVITSSLSVAVRAPPFACSDFDSLLRLDLKMLGWRSEGASICGSRAARKSTARAFFSRVRSRRWSMSGGA